jgi:UDP-3-O-[3-hydroxymyristoyl] glucosamine N-acyltransferase
MSKLTLQEIASHVQGELRGDSEQVIHGIAAIDRAQPGELTFLDNPKYRRYLATTRASAVIVAPEIADSCTTNAVVVEQPYVAYAQAAELFELLPQQSAGIGPNTIISESAQIHPSASIGTNCVIGERVIIGEHAVIGSGTVIGDDCELGANTRLWPNVTLYHNIRIGERCVVHSGVVIGADGFGLVKHHGAWQRIPQLGGVIIGNDVSIGANTAIDRGALSDTVIENGVKLDNLIQVGHNVVIGEHTAIAGCVAIAGSAKIGRHCMIAGGSCIGGHLEIADNVVITAMSGVSNSIKQPGVYSAGIAVRPNNEWRRNSVRFHHLDDMARRLRALEKTMTDYDHGLGHES